MKVLLIGNNEFIAESLIKGFLIEKDKIMLVGSLNKKKIDSLIMEKIKYYPVDIASDKCEDLFVVNNPDVVVYFDNANEDLNNDMTETQRLDHVNNLINTHYYALKAKVSRFVYISTTKLGDPSADNNSEWYKAHRSCELFLKDFDTHQTTKCIVLRTAELYGYGYNTDNSIITRLIRKRLYEKEDDSIDMSKSYDFIHVDDFSAAVRRSLQLYKSYTLNIASGYRIPLNIVNNVIENIDWVDDELIDNAKLIGEDISETVNLTGFAPSISLLDGLREVYDEELSLRNNLIGSTFMSKLKEGIR